MWWRFRKHKLALVSPASWSDCSTSSSPFADFLAYSDPLASEAQRALIAPQPVHLFDDGRFGPYVDGLVGAARPADVQTRLRGRPERQGAAHLSGAGLRRTSSSG